MSVFLCFLTLVACVTSAAHDATLDLLDSQNSDPLQLHWKKQDGGKKFVNRVVVHAGSGLLLIIPVDPASSTHRMAAS